MKKLILILCLLVNIAIGQIRTDSLTTDSTYFEIESSYIANKKAYNALSIMSVGNDTPGNATLITNCVSSFTSTNYNSAAEGCGTYANNVDCNNSTGIYGGGVDLSYTVERDIWYKFCPANNGNWTISVTPSNCVLSSGAGSGFQWSVLQGTASNFGWIYFSNGCGNWSCTRGYNTTQTAIINVSNYLNGCIFINIDGYAGNQCDFALTISNTSCTLPIELLYFNGKNDNNINTINWATATELNNNNFIIEKSYDAIEWIELANVPGSGNSTSIKKYYTIDSNPINGINYYRLTQVDYNGASKVYNIIAIDNTSSKLIKLVRVTNILGQEVDVNSPGLKILMYSDGTYTKKIETSE